MTSPAVVLPPLAMSVPGPQPQGWLCWRLCRLLRNNNIDYAEVADNNGVAAHEGSTVRP